MGVALVSLNDINFEISLQFYSIHTRNSSERVMAEDNSNANVRSYHDMISLQLLHFIFPEVETLFHLHLPAYN